VTSKPICVTTFRGPTDVGKHGNQSPPAEDAGSPVTKLLDPKDRLTFGKVPLNEAPDLVSCSKCERPILRHAVGEHLENCMKETAKKKVANGKEKVNGKSTATNGEIAVMPPKTKKRKSEEGTHTSLMQADVSGESTPENTPPKKKPSKKQKENGEPTPKKEKKKKVKPAVPKQKRTPITCYLSLVPVDPERQCGVYDPEKGTQCARSLTCKSHSMSAKRAVPGRSQPYDTLLSLWQRKNQAKTLTTQKPVAQVEAEDIDSEEEVRLVMQGVMKRYCRPLEQRCLVGVRRKVRGMRMFEGFKAALMGNVQNIAGSGAGRGRRQSQATET
jgi:SCA7, zinc-binding domain